MIKTRQREAEPTYEGERGHQPILALCAKTGLVLADEFRDGNMPAMMERVNVVQATFLPRCRRRRVRSVLGQFGMP